MVEVIICSSKQAGQLCWRQKTSCIQTFDIFFSTPLTLRIIFLNFDSNYSVCCSLSHVWFFVTSWTAALQASLSTTLSQSLLRFMSIELVLLSNHHIIWLLLLLPSIFPSIRVFSSESALCIRWPEYWSFSISPSNEYSGLISYKIDWFDLLWSEELSRVFFSTTIWKHQFFGSQPSLLSNSCILTWILEKP